MKKITIIIAGVCILINCKISAQDWVSMMQNPNANVHDVQTAFYKWYELHKSKDNTGKNDLQKGNDEIEEQGSELFKRWEHQMVPRTFPSGNRPDKLEIAREYRDYLTSRRKTQSHKVDNISNWSYVGNASVPLYGGDGRVNRLHFYPGNTNIIYATSPGGGLWKSTDGGNSWATNTDQLEEIGTGDLAINPLNSSIMYLGTGDNDAGGDYTPNTIGVLRSNDSGVTWNATGLTYTLAYASSNYITVNQLIFNPSDTGTLFASTSSGLFYSKDDGTTWTQAINDNIKDVEFEPFHSSTVYAGSFTGKFYRSADSGRTFVRITAGLPTAGMERLAVGTTPADSNTVYLVAVDSANYGFYGLYRSTDRGQTFTAKSVRSSGAPNLLGWTTGGSDSSGQAWYNLAIQVSPTYADSVFVAGSWLWISADGGINWTFDYNFYYNVHIDIHSILFYPGSSSHFLLSSDGGVFETPDAGNTWNDLSNNLAIAEQYSIGPSADNSSLWITGWQDNSCNLSSPSWQAVFGGDGMTCFIDYSNDNNMYASSENGYFGSSSDGGVTWNTATGGITETGEWDTPWLQDPQQPDNLISGFQNVWSSYDQGYSWNPISSWGSYYINALAVAPSDDQCIYASEYYALYGTSNGGSTWNDLTGTLPVIYVYISAIAVDPENPLHIWVTFSGWNSSYKVYKSTDGGTTWTNISSGLPNLPVNCIVYQGGTPDGIYIGTDIGVYYMDNTTGGWIPFNTSLPNVQVFDLKIYPSGNLLDAATYGRGTWQSPTYVSTGIDKISSTNFQDVYPNPNKGEFTVALNHAELVSASQLTIEIYNSLGVRVYGMLKPVQHDYELNLSNQPDGVYFYRVLTVSQNVIGEGKIIIEK